MYRCFGRDSHAPRVEQRIIAAIAAAVINGVLPAAGSEMTESLWSHCSKIEVESMLMTINSD